MTKTSESAWTLKSFLLSSRFKKVCKKHKETEPCGSYVSGYVLARCHDTYPRYVPESWNDMYPQYVSETCYNMYPRYVLSAIPPSTSLCCTLEFG
jgi:hypothetical protein